MGLVSFTSVSFQEQMLLRNFLPFKTKTLIVMQAVSRGKEVHPDGLTFIINMIANLR